MKTLPLVMIGLVIISSLLISPAVGERNQSTIKVETDLQMLEYPPVYGGHITWHISGQLAKELRDAIAQKYHVRAIDLATASHYFKNDLEKVIENNRDGCGYLAFVRLYRADPLHDDTNGILNDDTDVAGLIGDVNSTNPITLKMIVRGEPMENNNYPLMPKNMFYAPFIALVDNYSKIFVSFPSLRDAHLEFGHYEVLAGFGNIENMPSGVTSYRLIVGEFFISGDRGHVVKYAPFDPLESPLILFILFLISSYSFRKIEEFLYSRNSERIGPVIRKRVKQGIFGTRISLLAIYFLYLFGGLIYLLILIASIAILFIFIHWYYGRYAS